MSETEFALTRAGWPAMLVDEAGAILQLNQAARASFGPALEEKPALSTIWSPENTLDPAAFLGAPGGASPVLLKLRDKAGQTVRFNACLAAAPASPNVSTTYFLQLMASQDPAPASLAGPARPSGETTSFRKSDSLEAGVAQKQKLDCALQLTRTVALDFNNALTTILGHTSLVLSKMEPKHPWRASLVEVEKSAEKAAEIAHDLATFSLQEKDIRAQVAGNLNDLVRRTVGLFQAPYSTKIEWVLELEPRLYAANFDEAKMQQALMKILDNASQAVGDHGRVEVRTQNRDLTEPLNEDGVARLARGYYVCIEITDNGCGISPEVLPRIFEPFFTTKKGPVHRGLGLAWVYGIVTNHGGSVAVSSGQGQGARVRLYLPALRKYVKEASPRSADLSGTQTILMIDDEDLLLTMGETVLSSYGYRVLTANNGLKGLEIFGNSPSEIDLVITDLVMPKMSGRELIERLRKISPSVKIICSSGYIRSVNGVEEDNYLQKPFTSQDLLRKVKDAIGQS